MIVRDGAAINAFAASCPQAGTPLAEGALCNHRLVCPWHKATFRISDGSVLEPSTLDALIRHAVHIDGDTVMVSPEPIASLLDPLRVRGRTVLILGSGAGGTAAAVFFREAGFSGRITMIG